MKKSSKLLALGLILFLGACSLVDDKFLDKVKGKTANKVVIAPPDEPIGTFSSNGKSFDWVVSPAGDPTMIFIEASDENTAKYRLPDGSISTIKMADGKMGDISGAGGPLSFFLN